MWIFFFAESLECCSSLQRRRDRINEKMKALQELIPRCNKVNLDFIFLGYYYIMSFNCQKYTSFYIIFLILLFFISVGQSFNVGWGYWIFEITSTTSSGTSSFFCSLNFELELVFYCIKYKWYVLIKRNIRHHSL